MDHTELTCQLIDWVQDQGIPGTFTFDIYFTNATILNYVHGKQLANGQPRGYVGSLKCNRKVEYKGHVLKVSELAASIAPEVRKPLREGDRQQWYFSCTLHLPAVQHKVRIVILWKEREASQARIILVTNRVYWEVSRIVRTYRHRWTGTETFPRDGRAIALKSRLCQRGCVSEGGVRRRGHRRKPFYQANLKMRLPCSGW